MLQESDRIKDKLNATASVKSEREAQRLAELDNLGAVRTEADRILQELVDEVRNIFGTDLCMVNLILSDVQYFRAWSGWLPANLVEARQDLRENSMCPHIVATEVPLVVCDFLATDKFKDQHYCVEYGFRFYAGAPLITSGGHAIGTLCLLNTRPMQFGEEQMRLLSAFARTVAGRLELLGALEREQAAKEEEVQRSQKLQRTLDSLSAHMAIVDESGTIIAVNRAWRQFAEANGAVGRSYLEGANYLQVCDSATGPWSEEAAPFAEGIRSVLKGQLEKFTLEYPCHSPSERRWFVGRVTPFAATGPPQAVIAHEDITESKEAEQRLKAQYAVTRILEESATLDEATPKILRAICESLGWQVGGLWHLDRQAGVLRCARMWHATSVHVPQFDKITRQITFPRSTGLPGRVWASGKPAWISDAVKDANFTRASVAAKEGLHGAVALPILLRGEVLGVMEFFSHEIRRPDAAVLEMMMTVGTQIGQFIERKQVEEKLRESEKRFRSLIQNASDIITILEADGTVRYESPAIERVLGYKPEELVGKDAFDYVHAEDLERVLDTFLEGVANDQPTAIAEFRFRHKDGSWRYLEAIGNNLLDDPSVSGVVINSRDITERKQAEKTLQENEARLNTVLNNLTEGVLIAESQGHVIFANPAVHTMLDVSREGSLEELPDPWEDLNLPEAVAYCAKNNESIEARVRYEETFLWVRLECLVEFDKDQGDVLVVIQDLSEGRRLEASQQRFLVNAAHQLRTPTMAILGAAELLATGDDADPTIRRRLLNHIFSEGRRMQQLSETLLRLSRVGWDRREPNLQIVEPSEAGHQAAERMAPLVENMGLRVLVEGKDTYVRADPEWLQEVLLTLLSNAIKHSNRGADVRLRVSAGTIIVEDEGAGINPDDLPHIFERFYRGKGNSEGFGLGLPICRELIERMGGSISISSREGVGTTVKIELPEVDAAND